MRFRRSHYILSLLLCMGAGAVGTQAANAVVVKADYRVPIKTILMRPGTNEKDRAEYFSGVSGGNSVILQNHRDIGTRYIRIWADSTNWGIMDARVKAVIDCGAVPLMCLEGYSDNVTTYGDQCVAIVNRYRARYNVADWHWEILNEPNNNNRMSLSTYLNVYNAVETRIHAIASSLLVGGPGTAGLALDWQEGLLKNARAKGVQFLTWHRYGCWAEPYQVSDAELMAGTHDYETDVDKMAALVARNRPGTQIITGELNMNAWAGVWQGSWNTDPRIKSIFNAPWYASAFKHLLNTGLGNGVSAELFWEGTGDDTPGGCVGFGLWYSQQPTVRGAAYFAKQLMSLGAPYNGELVQCDDGGSPNLEAWASRKSSAYYLVLINKSTASVPVEVHLNGISPSSMRLSVIDGTAFQAGALRAEALPISTNQNVTMDGYSVALITAVATQDTTVSTPPAAPSNVQVTNPGVGPAMNLSWTNPTDSDFSHVHIYRSTDPETLGPKIADNVTGVSYSDTGVSGGTTYYYVIRAVDTDGNESKNADAHSGKPTNAGGISILSINCAVPMVGQGEASVPVTMAVRNNASSPLRVLKHGLSFISGGNDVSSSFQVTPTTSYTTINAGSTVTFRYLVDVGASAPTGSVTVNGDVVGYTVSSNLVANDSFETLSGGRPSGWTPWAGITTYTDAADSSTRVDGSYSYKMSVSNTSAGGAALSTSNQATCLANTSYIFGCYWKTGGQSAVGKTMILNELDAAGNSLGGTWLWLDHVTNWTQGAMDITTKPSTAKISVEFRLSPSGAGQSENAWWDMAFVIKSSDYLEDTEATTPLQWSIAGGLSPAWSYSIGAEVKASPAALNGVVYVGAEDGYFYAIQGTGSNAGTLLWRTPLGSPVRGRAAISSGVIYVTTFDGNLHALDLGTGAPRSGFPVTVGSEGLISTPAEMSGRVFVSLIDGRVCGVDSGTGEIPYDTMGLLDNPVSTSPSVPRVDFVWVVSDSGTLYRLSSDLRVVLWTRRLSGAPGDCSPTIIDDRLYQADSSKRIQCMSAVNAAPIWGPTLLSGAVDKTLWVDDSGVYGAMNDGKLGGWNPLTGEALAGYPVSLSTGSFNSAPMAVKRNEAGAVKWVYLGSASGRFFAVKADDPSERLVFKAPSAMLSSPAATGATATDVVAIGCSDGKVYGFLLK